MALAMLGLCWAAGVGWHEAAYLANVAAGLEVEKFGIAAVTRDEVLAELRAHLPLPQNSVGNALCGVPQAGTERKSDRESDRQGEASVGNALRGVPLPRPSPFDYDALTRRCPEERVGCLGNGLPRSGQVLSLGSLLPRLEAHRREGRKIVFTNGCFDLLHVGHVRCLEEAAALGDVLIVAVNSDDSVRRLKGPGHPVVRQRDRAAMVAALGCIDYVTIFATDTPLELLRLIKPDVLAKGGSCSKGDVEGRELVEAQGGEVRITGRVRGVSTTRTLSRIVQRSGT